MKNPNTLRSFALPVVMLALIFQGGDCGGGGGTGCQNVRVENRGAVVNSGVVVNAPQGREEGAAVNANSGGERLAQGTWGGVGIRLDVGDRTVSLEFDCASGQMGVPDLDGSGSFSVAGTFSPERGGPVREGEEPKRLSARYGGKVEGDSLTLRVEFEGASEPLSYTLKRGAAGRLRKCL